MSDLRRVKEADLPKLTAFLKAHAPIAMFQLRNLLNYGLNGDHPDAMTFWMNDPVTDVLGITQIGIVQPVITSEQVGGIADVLSNQTVAGVVSTAHGTLCVKQALNLPPARLDRIEPHYELAITDLIMPDVDGLTLAPYPLVPRDVLIAWRTAYYIEALEVAAKDAPARAIAHVDATLESGDHHVLMQGTTPLSVTGLNTQFPEIVMVGGVYTPPELRGHGFAAKALALNLVAAQKRGVTRAVLSAANEAAARTYEKIGFQKMGEFGITILDAPVKIHG